MVSEDVLKHFIDIIPALVATGFGAFVTIQLARMKVTLNQVHVLSNSNMGIALKLNASNARFKADTTGKPEDIRAADEAERKLVEHEKSQLIVDGMPKN